MLFLLSVATVSAQKGGTNAPPLGMVGVPSGETVYASVTAEDVARGWQLLEERTNAISFAMPESATRCEAWWRRGAYEDATRIAFCGLEFPWGDIAGTSLWACAWGRIRALPCGMSNEIVAVDAPMAAVPGRSQLWWDECADGTCRITWERFFLNRDTNTPVNAQIELLGNGDFLTRSNEVERICHWLDPDDWDGDGWCNGEDAHPYVWDDAVTDLEQTLPENANTNAYCWVDVTCARNAHVQFVGDGISDLPDPSFTLCAGDICRVTLLIGKTYFVTSGVSLSVVAKSSDAIVIEGEGTRELAINWPVEICAMEGNGDSFMMMVSPSSLGGVFDWIESCCTIYGEGVVFRHGCSGNCGCAGCYAEGTYCYEGYSLSVTGGWCGCDESGYPDDPSSTATGVSVAFSKSALIFEDAYENAPGEWEPRRSTLNDLSCTVNGGPNGGFVTVEVSGGEKLSQYLTMGRTLPIMQSVAPNETVSFVNRYEAMAASSNENDIVVTATFIENDTGWVDTSVATTTAVRVEFNVRKQMTQNPCWNRHTYGVRETVDCVQFPQRPSVELMARGGSVVDAKVFICSLTAEEYPIAICYGNVEYRPRMAVIEPSGVEALTVWAERYSVPTNFPGGIGMGMRVYVLPRSVCFSGIAIAEVVDNNGWGVDYFTNQYFRSWISHASSIGAGTWCDVDDENFIGTDHPAVSSRIPYISEDGLEITLVGSSWPFGEIHMPTPMGWNERGTTGGALEIGRFAASEMQIMSLLEDGQTNVRKYQNVVARRLNGQIYKNGRLQDESEIIDISNNSD